MFSNFIHLIVALLILSLYEPIEAAPLSWPVALSFFLALTLAFAAFTLNQFQRLAHQVERASHACLDHQFSVLVARHTILALIVFAIDIWGLHLPTYLEHIKWLSLIPTLKALLFWLLFIAHLVVVWACAYTAHRRIYRTEVSRKTYVYSNFAFTIPILIPWTLVFGITDLIRLLPFELPKRILDTTVGQIVYFVFFLLVAAIFAPVLMQRFWRCHPMPTGRMRNRIEALCLRAGVRYADIVHWPIFGGRMITAGVMGLVARFRYIMVTDALLQMLTPDQIDQVIAHEIGHIKHRHLQLYLIFFIGVMLISYALVPVGHFLIFFFKPTLHFIFAMGLDIHTFAYLFTSVLMIIGIVLYFRYLFGYFMRNFERQADTYVFQLFPTAQPLIETFGKIVATSGQPADKPNWHHFSIMERINFLKKCEHSAIHVQRHNKKVRNSIFAVLAGFLLIGGLAFHMNQKVFRTESLNINVQDIERYLENKSTKTVQDGMLYMLVGHIHYEQKRFISAAAAYESSLALQPDNPDAMNNLAWLLASEDEKQLHDAPRALKLAQKAIEIKQTPYIWDTLAQALFVNGRIQEAIKAEEEALALNPEDSHFYEAKLKQFKQALDEATSQ